MTTLWGLLHGLMARLGYADDDEAARERVRDLERRLAALDADIGAQQATRTRERLLRDTQERHERHLRP